MRAITALEFIVVNLILSFVCSVGSSYSIVYIVGANDTQIPTRLYLGIIILELIMGCIVSITLNLEIIVLNALRVQDDRGTLVQYINEHDIFNTMIICYLIFIISSICFFINYHTLYIRLHIPQYFIIIHIIIFVLITIFTIIQYIMKIQFNNIQNVNQTRIEIEPVHTINVNPPPYEYPETLPNNAS